MRARDRTCTYTAACVVAGARLRRWQARRGAPVRNYPEARSPRLSSSTRDLMYQTRNSCVTRPVKAMQTLKRDPWYFPWEPADLWPSLQRLRGQRRCSEELGEELTALKRPRDLSAMGPSVLGLVVIVKFYFRGTIAPGLQIPRIICLRLRRGGNLLLVETSYEKKIRVRRVRDRSSYLSNIGPGRM